MHAVCPFCNCISKEANYEDLLWYFDYVDQSMIWCDGCKARAFLDVSVKMLTLLDHEDPSPSPSPSYDEIKQREEWITNNIVDAKEVPQELVSKIMKKYEDDIKQIRFFRVKVLFITRIKNFQLLHYTAKDPVPEENISKWIKLNSYNYHVNEYTDGSVFGMIEKSEDNDNYQEFNVSLPCNSYNAKNPAKPYPEGFELPHDGMYVCCEVLHHGIIRYYKYWGD